MKLDFNNIGIVDKELINQTSSQMIPDILKRKSAYHYTSIGGLKNILEKKSLWFTNIDYMNDRHEVVQGLSQFEKASKKLYRDRYDEKCKNIISKLKKQKNNIFVCCFTLDRDELSMWNYYTKDINHQGYNIGFDYKKLVISLLKNNKELHGCNFSFGNVDYCLSKKTYAVYTYDWINESLKLLFNSIFAVLNGEKQAEDVQEMNIPYVKYFGEIPAFKRNPSLDMSIMCFMKEPCFSNENEFRIVIQATDEALEKLKQEGKYKFRESNGILVPYLDLSFNAEDIVGITISPMVKSDLSTRSIADYCSYCQIDSKELKEGIRKSKIPARF